MKPEEKAKKVKKVRKPSAVSKFFKEFGEFISRGNVMTMAVGIIIGGAFNAIVTSLVNSIIMPPISLLLGNEVSELKWVLRAATEAKPEIALTWGLFVQAVLNFLIVAFSLFIIIKVMNTLSKQAELLKHQLLTAEQKKALEEEAAAAEAKAAEEEAKAAEEAAKAAAEAAKPSEEILLLREILTQLKSKK